MIFKSKFMQTMNERGFVHNCTDSEGVDNLAPENLTAYVGFDATGDSLHIGSLMSLMALRILQRCGGSPIVLVGTGTSKIGDPSDKNTQRPMLSNETIRTNANGFFKAFDAILGTDKPADYRTKIVENGAWLNNLNYVDFLREVGSHFTINRMLTMDFVKSRLENNLPLTFLEFNYVICQAFDFAELFKRHGCVLQMGGSDQWGNIVNGIDLGRRLHNAELFGLTTPLLTSSDGKKMGKTADGEAIWLNADKTSPYEYFQFWRNVNDKDVRRFMLLFTDMEILQIDLAINANINQAKETLAFEATRILHGDVEAQNALNAAHSVFNGHGVWEGVPTIKANSISVIDAVLYLEFADTRSAVRRLMEQNGVKINDRIVKEDTKLTKLDFLDEKIKVSVGKKKHGIVVFEP